MKPGDFIHKLIFKQNTGIADSTQNTIEAELQQRVMRLEAEQQHLKDRQEAITQMLKNMMDKLNDQERPSDR